MPYTFNPLSGEFDFYKSLSIGDTVDGSESTQILYMDSSNELADDGLQMVNVPLGGGFANYPGLANDTSYVSHSVLDATPLGGAQIDATFVTEGQAAQVGIINKDTFQVYYNFLTDGASNALHNFVGYEIQFNNLESGTYFGRFRSAGTDRFELYVPLSMRDTNKITNLVDGTDNQDAVTVSQLNSLIPDQTGNSGEFLTTDGSTLSWASVAATPGGSDTEIQYNSSGAFAADSDFTRTADGVKIGGNTFYDSGYSEPNYIELSGRVNAFHISDYTGGSQEAGASWIVQIPSSPGSGYIGQYARAQTGGGATTASLLTGLVGEVYAQMSSGTITNIRGGAFGVSNSGGGTVTSAVGFEIASAINSGGGTIGTNYGLIIAAQTAGGTNYSLRAYDGLTVFNENGATGSLRIEGDTDQNLFFADYDDDRIGIGTNTPSSKLHVVGNSLLNGNVDLRTTSTNRLYLPEGSDSEPSLQLGSDGAGIAYESGATKFINSAQEAVARFGPNINYFAKPMQSYSNANGFNVEVTTAVNNPIYTFRNATTTGMGRGSNVGELAFWSNGTRAITIDTSQNTLFAGDIEVSSSSDGVILESPDATRWRVQVDNSGNLTTTAI